MNRTRIFGQAQTGASAGNRARALGALALAWLALSGGGAGAATVTVSVQEFRGTYSVRAVLQTEAPPEVAWSVLSDYDHIDTFVGSMRASTSERRPDGRLFVRQVAAVGAFPLHKTVRVNLEVLEEQGRSIAFHDVLGQDFRTYAGAWEIGADSTGTIVQYWLEAAPKTFVPFVGRSMMARGVRDLLAQVGTEIQRRAALEPAPGANGEPAPALRSSRRAEPSSGVDSPSHHDPKIALVDE